MTAGTLLLLALALAAPDPWPVPADAVAVVRVKDWRVTRGAVAKLQGVVAPGAKVPAFADLAGGRDFEALAAGRPVYVALLGFDGLLGGTPPVVAFLPVGGLKEFRAKLLTADERKEATTDPDGVTTVPAEGGALYAAAVPGSGYVAVGYTADVVRPLAKKQTPLDPAPWPAAVREVVDTFDVALVVPGARLLAAQGATLQGYAQLANFLLSPRGATWARGFDPGQLDVVRRVVGGTFQAILDGEATAVGLVVKPEAVTLRLEHAVRAKTDSAKLLAAEAPDELASLMHAQQGFSTVSVSRFGPAVADVLAGLTREFAAEADTPAARAVEAWRKASKPKMPLVTLRASAAEGSVELRDPLVPLEAGVEAFDAPGAARALRRVFAALPAGAGYQNLPLAEAPRVKAEPREHRGCRFDEVGLKLDLEASVKNIADANLREATLASVRRLAAEKTTLFVGHGSTAFVQVAAADWPAAQKLLDRAIDMDKPLERDPLAVAARQALPARASKIWLCESGPLLATAADYLQAVGGAMPAFPGWELPEFKVPAKPARSVCGFSVTLAPGRVGAAATFPAAALKLARESKVTPE